MNRLALGTVQFGQAYGIANREGQLSRTTAKAMLQMAASSGIDTLDTAIAYGESETCLGEVGTRGFRVITKLPAVPPDCADVSGWMETQVTESLSRLGAKKLFGLLLHRPDQLLEGCGREIFQTLQNLKKAKRVKKVGISIYSPDELEKLIPRYRFDLVQAPFSLVDRRLHTSGWLGRLKEAGVEVHTRSTFLQGLLLVPRESIPSKFSRWSDLWNKWHVWLERNDSSAVEACLTFPFSFPEIDHVVVGADSVGQLEQIVQAATGGYPGDLPDLRCDDEDLINPTRWRSS
jgi:aryl-alcohol dehydrogenase-like predicted oxidoreductase